MLRAILAKVREILFVGSYTHLWYLLAVAIATLIVCWVVKKKIDKKIVIPGFLILYVIGLLEESYYGLLRPLESIPLVWTPIRLYELVFKTTRNGLFFGSIYIGMGALFAYRKIHMRQSMAIVGFIISMFFMLLEALCVEYLDLVKGHDFYVFLLPAVFFLFYIVTHIEIEETRTTIALRKYSSLIFFVHLWVNWVIGFIERRFESFLNVDIQINSLLRYTMVALGSLAVAMIVVELQKHKSFKWLKAII